MDYEKKYNEALGRAKDMLVEEGTKLNVKEVCEHIFPEITREEKKQEFYDVLVELLNRWKGALPQVDFAEVLFNFETRMIMPETNKVFGYDDCIINKHYEQVCKHDTGTE